MTNKKRKTGKRGRKGQNYFLVKSKSFKGTLHF